jgi:N-acetylneuraminic acid mutarotase
MRPLLCAVLLIGGCGPAPPRYEDGWSAGPGLPEAVQELHAAVLHGSIYVAGGIAAGNVVSTRAYRLDSAATAWVRVADLPAPRHHMPLAVAADSLYAIGGFGASGFDAVATLWVYDAGADRWQERAPLPVPRGASAATTVGERIVVVGGAGLEHRLVEASAVYDPRAGRWSLAAPVPTPRDHLAAVSLDGQVYAIGGRPLDPDRNFATVERYDPAADRWSPLDAMPTPRGGLAAAVLEGNIHVVGGETSRRVFTEHEVWGRPGGWRTAPRLPTGRHGLAAAAVGGRLYVVGGGPRAGLAQTPVVEVYDPVPATRPSRQ